MKTEGAMGTLGTGVACTTMPSNMGAGIQTPVL